MPRMDRRDEAGPLGPLLWLAVAVLWAALMRLPLLLHAAEHLDSDLAVDGLTLIDALHGDWRWHYPGTPHIGIPPVLLSAPSSLVFGANPASLASGGLLAYALLQVFTFGLVWSGFGRRAAVWSLAPLAFGSIGSIWLSGRITGGHLPTAAWLAAGFLLMLAAIRRGGSVRIFLLGVWCGFGLYLDSLALTGCVGIVAVMAGAGAIVTGPYRRAAGAVVLAVGFAVGAAPRWIGARADPHDSYGEQFATILTHDRQGSIDWSTSSELAAIHAEMLAFECLPRLIGGRLLTDYRQEPAASTFRHTTTPPPAPDVVDPLQIAAAWWPLGCFSLAGFALIFRRGVRSEGDSLEGREISSAVRSAFFVVSACFLAFLVFRRILDDSDPMPIPFPLLAALAAFGTLGIVSIGGPRRGEIDTIDRVSRGAVRWGLLLVSALIVAGFLLNRNIYNSDNYRYLVPLLVPYSLGFGLGAEALARRGAAPRGLALGLVVGLAGFSTYEAAHWYRGLGWLDSMGEKPAEADPILEWLAEHPEIEAVYGGYWDVYRLAFLTGGRVQGVPFPNYPDRFPEIAKRFPGYRPRTLIARRDSIGEFNRRLAIGQGATILLKSPDWTILDWPPRPGGG